MKDLLIVTSFIYSIEVDLDIMGWFILSLFGFEIIAKWVLSLLFIFALTNKWVHYYLPFLWYIMILNYFYLIVGTCEYQYIVLKRIMGLQMISNLYFLELGHLGVKMQPRHNLGMGSM
eukprot:NODE_427_length_7663_cov_0.258461.p8 type:complete len:118 gc:universal NODE_427_length_7663_cov_0.258461:4727-4374(-)